MVICLPQRPDHSILTPLRVLLKKEKEQKKQAENNENMKNTLTTSQRRVDGLEQELKVILEEKIRLQEKQAQKLDLT